MEAGANGVRTAFDVSVNYALWRNPDDHDDPRISPSWTR